MDRQYIRDHQVIERYLKGTLTAEEEQAFEEAYLEDTELLDELQAAERLREGLKDLDASGRLDQARAPAGWRRAFASTQYAAAASVLLAVTVVFSTSLYRENRALRDETLAAATPRVVLLEAVRGGDASEIPAVADDEWLTLLIDAGPAKYDSYRAIVERRGNATPEEVWNRDGLASMPGSEIAIGLPGRALSPGSYEIRLEGRMDDWATDRFDAVTTLSMTVRPRD